MKKKNFFFAIIAILLIASFAIYFLQIRTGSSLIAAVVNFSLDAVEKIGYLGIFITMSLESTLVPIPSEVVMTFAGFLSWTGKMDMYLAITAGTLGNLVGSFILYKIGNGPGFVLLEKYGKYLLIDKKDIMQAQDLFSKYGKVIVLIGRMLPAVRTVISLPAGIAKMSLREFLLFTLIGSIPWNSILVYLGWLLGENWIIIEEYARILDYVVIFAIILLVGAYIIYKEKNK